MKAASAATGRRARKKSARLRAARALPGARLLFTPREPASEAELLERARALAGFSVAELALRAKIALPAEPRRAKGLIGALVERALGIRNRPGAGVDLPQLGVELKTIPLSRDGRPRESTYVCNAALASAADDEWERSLVRAKLRRVLFVPVEVDTALGARRIGASFLWSPTAAEEALLRADFEELVGALGRGEAATIDARRGHALQLRPKGKDARARTRGVDERGAPLRAQPRAFYLRARFTRGLLPAYSQRPCALDYDLAPRAAQHLL